MICRCLKFLVTIILTLQFVLINSVKSELSGFDLQGLNAPDSRILDSSNFFSDKPEEYLELSNALHKLKSTNALSAYIFIYNKKKILKSLKEGEGLENIKGEAFEQELASKLQSRWVGDSAGAVITFDDMLGDLNVSTSFSKQNYVPKEMFAKFAREAILHARKGNDSQQNSVIYLFTKKFLERLSAYSVREMTGEELAKLGKAKVKPKLKQNQGKHENTENTESALAKVGESEKAQIAKNGVVLKESEFVVPSKPKSETNRSTLVKILLALFVLLIILFVVSIVWFNKRLNPFKLDK